MKIRVMLIQEIAGFPREHVEKAMEEMNKHFAKLKGIEVLKDDVKEAKLVGEKTWSMYVDKEVLVDDFGVLVDIIFEFMPSSVEIIEPDNLEFDAGMLTDLLNDLAAKMHGYDSALKQAMAMRVVLEKKLKNLGVDDPWKEFKKNG